MADSISTPWILDYLISVAEQHGGDLAAVLPRDKGVKAQLVKFLSFPPQGHNEPCSLWVEISDKKHIIRARLSADAIEKYLQNPIYGGKPVTSYKSAFVVLKKLRPAFGRVSRRDCSGMTEESTLFLDVDEFQLKGAFGEAMWDSPTDIATDPNVRDWIHGLRQDGGGGNVLKLRKQQASAIAAEREQLAKQVKTTAVESHVQTKLDTLDVKVRVARKSAVQKPRYSTTADEANDHRPIASKETLRRASWKRLHTKMAKYSRPPDDILEQLLSLCGTKIPREDTIHKPNLTTNFVVTGEPGSEPIPNIKSSSPQRHSSRPQTPSQWSPSVKGSPRPLSDNDSSETDEDSDHDAVMDADNTNHDVSMVDDVPTDAALKDNSIRESHQVDDEALDHSSSSLTMPPPAQRRPQPPHSSVPYTTSSPQYPALSQAQPESTDYDVLDAYNDTLPPSSLPIPQSSLRLPPSSPSYTSTPVLWNGPLIRRVPPPQVTPLRPDPDASGEGRVLVQNSDTASPGSQRLAASQSQGHSESRDAASQSQSQEQSGSQSHSQRPSMLRNEIERAPSRPDEPEDPRNDQGDAAVGVAEKSQQSLTYAESQKSRQSLSYKGDSQSQDKAPEGASASITEVQTNENGEEAPLMEVEADAQTLGGGTSAAAPDDNAATHHTEESIADTAVRESVSSPMVVDDQQFPEGDAPQVGSAPTWVAIKAASSLEEADDSQTEVDELLSDPIRMEDEAALQPRKRVGKGRARKPRLDSDDERTAAVVDRYVSGARREDSPTERPRLPASPVVEVPTRPPTKRRRKGDDEVLQGSGLPRDTDVFTSGDSFREELAKVSEDRQRGETGKPYSRRDSDTVPSLSQPSAHDPSVWAVPTFMRKLREPKQVARSSTVMVKPGAVAVVAAASSVPETRRPVPLKRTMSTSPSPDRKAPPAKKQKIYGTVPMTDTPSQSTAKGNAPRQEQTTKASGSSSAVSPARASTVLSNQPAIHPKPTQPGEAGNSRDIRYVDLRAASLSSSRSSSRASRADSRGPRPVQSLRPPSGQSSASVKGKYPARPEKREPPSVPSRKTPILPALSGARSVKSQNAAQHPPEASRQTPPELAGSRSGSSRRGKAPADSGVLEPDARELAVDVPKPLLGGYKPSLELTRTPGGPPLLSWSELTEILLETGRARHEARASSRAGTGNTSK